jgi:tRNA(fMet)-specific endonuclease VapC
LATKTITIDLEAYERLSSARRTNESFSTVIKRVVRPPFDVGAYCARVAAQPLSAETVRAVERQIRRRRTPSTRTRWWRVSTRPSCSISPGSTPRRGRARAKLEELIGRGETLATTRFTMAELYVGVAAATNPEAEDAKVSALLQGIEVLEFDERAARLFGVITSSLRLGGAHAGDMDVLIAATALAAGHCVVTGNAAHFLRIDGLRVESYWHRRLPLHGLSWRAEGGQRRTKPTECRGISPTLQVGLPGEDARPERPAESEIRRLCFRKQAFPFAEFPQVFSETLGARSPVYERICRALAEGDKSVSELAEKREKLALPTRRGSTSSTAATGRAFGRSFWREDAQSLARENAARLDDVAFEVAP